MNIDETLYRRGDDERRGVGAPIEQFEASVESMQRVVERAQAVMDGSWPASLPTCQHGTPGYKECNACHEEYMAEQEAKATELLRDEFAGRILGGLFAGAGGHADPQMADQVAAVCYRYADAMLRARKQR